MNRTTLATLTLRLAALYFLLEAFLSATVLLKFGVRAADAADRSFVTGYTILVAASAAIGAVLWIASRRWAGRILGTEESGPIRAQDVGTLAFRLAGIWLLVHGARESGDVVGRLAALAGSDGRWVLLSQIASPALKLGLAATLLVGGARIARWCFPDGEDSRPSPSTLQPVAFSVLGLVILASALPVLVSNLVHLGSWFEEDESYYVSGGMTTPRLIAALLRVAIGLWLFIGFRPIVRFWQWAQTAGLERKSPSRA